MKKLALLIVAIITTFGLQAQKLKGDIREFANDKEINVEFVYGKVTYDGESEEKWLNGQKDKDDFEEWSAKWKSSFRTEKWLPKFLKGANEVGGEKGFTISENKKATYKVRVTIVDIDPGNFAGPFSNSAKLDGKFEFFKMGESMPMAIAEFKDCHGGGYFMTPVHEDRVGSAYENLGKLLGSLLVKKAK